MGKLLSNLQFSHDPVQIFFWKIVSLEIKVLFRVERSSEFRAKREPFIIVQNIFEIKLGNFRSLRFLNLLAVLEFPMTIFSTYEVWTHKPFSFKMSKNYRTRWFGPFLIRQWNLSGQAREIPFWAKNRKAKRILGHSFKPTQFASASFLQTLASSNDWFKKLAKNL